MSDDLLSEMSRAAREHVLSDPRWEDFARGTLAPAERDDLLAKAAKAGVDEETIAALGPRDETFDDALPEVAFAAFASSRERVAPHALDDATDASVMGGVDATDEAMPSQARTDASASGPSTRGTSAQPNVNGIAQPTGGAAANDNAPTQPRAPYFFGAAVLFAAAAALAITWSNQKTNLPEYALLVEGGVQTQRSDPPSPQGVIKVAPDSRIVLTMRPKTAANVAVGARVFLFGQGRSATVPAPVETAPSGAVRIVISGRELFKGLVPGPWELCVSVGPPDKLPTTGQRIRPPEKGNGFVTQCHKTEWQ